MKPKRVLMGALVDPALHHRCRIRAAEENITLSKWLERAAEEALSKPLFFANSVHFEEQDSSFDSTNEKVPA